MDMGQVFCSAPKQQRRWQGLMPVWLDAPTAILMHCSTLSHPLFTCHFMELIDLL